MDRLASSMGKMFGSNDNVQGNHSDPSMQAPPAGASGFSKMDLLQNFLKLDAAKAQNQVPLAQPQAAPTPDSMSTKLMSMLSGSQTQQAQQHPAMQQGSIFANLYKISNSGASTREKDDALDRAIDFFQEYVLREGPQTNESTAEKIKDRMIAQTIKSQYKSIFGKEY